MSDQLFQDEVPVDQIYNDLFGVKARTAPMSIDSANALAGNTLLIEQSGDLSKLDMMRNSLIDKGTSASVSALEQDIKQEDLSAVVEGTEAVLNPTDDIITFSQLVDTARKAKERIEQGSVDFEANAKISVLAGDLPSVKNPNALNEQQLSAEYWAARSQQTIEEKANALRKLQSIGEKSSGGFVETTGEFLQTAVPFFQQAAYAGPVVRSLADKGFIDANVVEKYVASGEMKQLIAESFNNIAPEQVSEWVDAFLSPFKNESGEVDVDDINALAYADIIGEMVETLENDGTLDATRILDNVFTVVDSVGIAQLVKGGYKSISSFARKSSVAESVKDSHRSSAVIAAAIQDPAIATRLGTTQAEAAVVAAYPKDVFADALAISPNIERYIPYAAEVTEEATKYQAVLSAADRQNAIASKIQDITDVFGVKQSAIVIKDSDYHGFTATMNLGARGSKAGFRSYEKALNALEEYGLSPSAPEVSIVRRNPDGTVEKVEQSVTAIDVKKGMVRLYHGGSTPDGGARWVTPDLKYAEGYAQKSGGAVYFVDIPDNSPYLKKAFDDSGVSVRAPFVAFEAPPSISKNLSLLQEANKQLPDLGRGVYYIQYEKKFPFTAEDASAFTDLAPSSLLPDALRESTNIFNKATATTIAAGYDKQSYLVTALGKASEPFNKLAPWKRSKVAQAAQFSKNEGRYLSRDELLDKYKMSDDEIDGYASLVLQDKVLYQAQNAQLAKEMDTLGILRVANEQTGFDSFGKPMSKEVTQNNYAGQYAYHPTANRMVALDMDMIERIYNEGGKVVNLAHRQKLTDNEFYNLVIATGDTKVLPRPVKVLNEVPGYFGVRIYQEAFFIDKIPKKASFNGKEVTDAAELGKYRNTIEAARTRKFGMDRVEELNATDPTHTYVLRQARESIQKSDLDFEGRVEYYMNNGLLRGTKRGDALKLTDGSLADQLDVMSSLATSRQNVADYVTHDQIVSSLKKSFMETYAKEFGLARFPVSKADLDSATAPAEMITSARAHWSYVNMLDRSSQTLGREAYSTAMRAISAAVQKLTPTTDADSGLTKIAQAVGNYIEAKAIKEGIKGRDPLGFARATGFYLMVAGNPLRQAVIQTTQHLMYTALEPAYMATGRMYKDSAALSTAFLLRGKLIAGKLSVGDPLFTEAARNNFAKTMGWKSWKELDKTIDQLQTSGILQNVDRHSIAEGSNRISQEVGNPLSYTVKSSIDAIPAVIRKVGFDPWEGTNRINTWLLARHRWMKANPGKDVFSAQATAEITGEAELLALNMNRGGQSPFLSSQSPLQLAFQYVAPAQKAFNQMMPVALGGTTALTGAEKARILAFQAALWGTAGIGLKEIYEEKLKVLAADSGVVIPPGFEDYLEGGLSQIAADFMLKNLGGEGGLDLTTVSPTRDHGLVGWMYSMIPGGAYEKSAVEAFFGPSATIFKRMYDKGQMAYDMMFMSPEKYDSEKAQAAVLSLASSFSSVNNYFAAKMAAERGYWANASGDKLVDAAWDQVLARGLFGFRTRAEADAFLISQRDKDVEEAMIDQIRKSFKRIDELEAGLSEESDLGAVATYYADLNLMLQSLETDQERQRFFTLWDTEVKRRVNKGASAPGYKALQIYLRTGDRAFEQMIINSNLPDDVKNIVREIKAEKDKM